MAGHSKWHNIRNRKGAQDAKRGKIFQKMSREIYMATKQGADPEMNPALRLSIEKAKSLNVPNDIVKRAIDKATGAGEEENFEEVVYEGYGPNGVAVLVYTLTENRNRTAANIRVAFTRNGGNLGSSGSVAYMFERKGRLMIERAEDTDEDMIMLAALEAGAEDIESSEEGFEIITEAADFLQVKNELEEAGIELLSADVEMVPSMHTAIAEENEEQFDSLIDALEDDDDVQSVYHNAEG